MSMWLLCAGQNPPLLPKLIPLCSHRATISSSLRAIANSAETWQQPYSAHPKPGKIAGTYPPSHSRTVCEPPLTKIDFESMLCRQMRQCLWRPVDTYMIMVSTALQRVCSSSLLIALTPGRADQSWNGRQGMHDAHVLLCSLPCIHVCVLQDSLQENQKPVLKNLLVLLCCGSEPAALQRQPVWQPYATPAEMTPRFHT